MGADAFGRRVRQARYALSARTGRQVTQAEVAKQLGVSGAAVGQWENGTKEPTLATIQGLAKALDVSAAWLAFGDDTPPARRPSPIDGLPADEGNLVDVTPSHQKKRRTKGS